VPSYRLFIALTVATVFVPRAARAQRQTYSNTNAWFQISGDVALNERWGILFDASNRRSGPIDETMANFIRAGLAYELTDNVRVAVGGNYSKSYPYGEIPAPYAVPEWRIWEQLALTHSIGKLDLSHRYRLEQRSRGLRSDPDVDETDVWAHQGRFRYQVKGTLPLRGEDVEAGEPYLTASNEIFISFGENVQYNIFDQDRAAIAFGYRMNRNWRVETGFMEHVVFKSNGIDVEHNHTLTFGLTYTRPAPKPPAGGGGSSNRTHDSP
jgi:uncharacterized protein DUF2490